jgi:4-hydroxy-tetrahydrodipicolinate synthase
MQLKGLFTALITPFAEDALDEKGLRQLIQRQLAAQVTGIVILGTTGESATVTEEEKERILAIALEEAQGKTLLIAGTGSNSTEKTIRETKRAYELGFDAALVVTPYYNKPTQEGIYQHFKALSAATPLPLIAYNIQGRTGVNIETPTLIRLAHLPHLIGVKEASGNMNQMADVLYALKQEQLPFSVLCGDDGLTLPLIALGGQGVISVVSNLFPTEMMNLVQAALAGDFARARKEHEALLPFFRAAFLETNPIPIKAALQHLGLPAGSCRLPLSALQDKNHAALLCVLQHLH